MFQSISEILISNPSMKGKLSGICTVCGIQSNYCLPKSEILSKSAASLTTLCSLNTEFFCPKCAEVWGETKKWARSILAIPNRVIFPTIALGDDPERPTWKQALLDLDRSQPRVCVMTTDPKKRIWCYAQISQGDDLSLYLHDPSRGISENRLTT